ncbi:hypothetical protein [Nostoc sp.]|uniref:hypothetical protein n=1 Tax=Nostoc sp. TaxID=1180 RepID=UPI002FF871D1
MQEFLFALTLSALPVASNFMGAMIAEALPSNSPKLPLREQEVTDVNYNRL